MKKIYVVGAMFCIFGLGLMIASYILTGGNFKEYIPTKMGYETKTYTCSGYIDDITIKGTSASVDIKADNVDKVTVNYAVGGRVDYDISENNGKLSIEGKTEKSSSIFESLFSWSIIDIEIIVPVEYDGNLNSELTSGSIKVGDSVSAKDINFKATSGSIKLEDVNIMGDVTMTASSGAVKLIDTSIAGDLFIKLSSGAIKFDELNVGSDITLIATSGSIRGKIAGDKDDYKISSSVTSGSSNLKNTSKGDKELNVDVTSGSISIEFD